LEKTPRYGHLSGKNMEKRRSKPLDVGASYIILPQSLMWANCSLILETRIEVMAKCFQFRVTKIGNLPASSQIEAGLATILDTCFVFVSGNITLKMKSEVLGMIPRIETIIYCGRREVAWVFPRRCEMPISETNKQILSIVPIMLPSGPCLSFLCVS